MRKLVFSINFFLSLKITFQWTIEKSSTNSLNVILQCNGGISKRLFTNTFFQKKEANITKIRKKMMYRLAIWRNPLRELWDFRLSWSLWWSLWREKGLFFCLGCHQGIVECWENFQFFRFWTEIFPKSLSGNSVNSVVRVKIKISENIF